MRLGRGEPEDKLCMLLVRTQQCHGRAVGDETLAECEEEAPP